MLCLDHNMRSRADVVQSMQAVQLITRLAAGYLMARCVLYLLCSSASNKSSQAGQCVSPQAGSDCDDPVNSLTPDVVSLEHTLVLAYFWLTAKCL